MLHVSFSPGNSEFTHLEKSIAGWLSRISAGWKVEDLLFLRESVSSEKQSCLFCTFAYNTYFFLSGGYIIQLLCTGIIVSHYKDLYEPAQVSWRNAEFSGMGLLWKTNHRCPADVIRRLQDVDIRVFQDLLVHLQNFPHLYQSENLNSLIHRSTGISSREATRARSSVRCTVKAGGTGKNRRPTGWQSVTYDPKNLRNFNFVLWKVLYFFSPFFFGETAFMWKKTWVQLDFFAGLCGAGHLIVEASWTFPHEEVPPVPDAADLERMVKREEILHTGKLKLKIIKASDTVDGWEIR